MYKRINKPVKLLYFPYKRPNGGKYSRDGQLIHLVLKIKYKNGLC